MHIYTNIYIYHVYKHIVYVYNYIHIYTHMLGLGPSMSRCLVDVFKNASLGHENPHDHFQSKEESEDHILGNGQICSQ